MNLIRMLRVSDTFTAEEIPLGRYRVVGLKVLPRFGQRGAAIRPAARPGQGPCPMAKEEAVELGTEKGGATVRVTGAGAGAQPEAAPAGIGRFVRWVGWLAGRLQRRRNPFGGEGPRLASTAVPRQGCLRLDGVKVVRNDLSDTDIEILPARRSAADKAATAEPAAVACDFEEHSSAGTEPAELRAGNL